MKCEYSYYNYSNILINYYRSNSEYSVRRLKRKSFGSLVSIELLLLGALVRRFDLGGLSFLCHLRVHSFCFLY